MDLHGVFIPITTPFDAASGDVDAVALRANLKRWSDSGVRGLVVGGSTGEAVLLDERERILCWEIVREAAPREQLLIAGTGAEARRTAIRYTKTAADLGYDAVLVQPPSFYKGAMKSDVVRDHYVAIAEASPVPVIVYQVPTRFCTLDFETGLVARLSEHPGIAGIKDSRGKLSTVGELVTHSAPGFQVLVGSGSLLYAALQAGAKGGILGVANFAPKESAAIERGFRHGNHAEAGRIQERVGRLHKHIVQAMGVGGVKCAMEELGFAGGVPRAPLRGADAEQRRRICELLDQTGLRAA